MIQRTVFIALMIILNFAYNSIQLYAVDFQITTEWINPVDDDGDGYPHERTLKSHITGLNKTHTVIVQLSYRYELNSDWINYLVTTTTFFYSTDLYLLVISGDPFPELTQANYEWRIEVLEVSSSSYSVHYPNDATMETSFNDPTPLDANFNAIPLSGNAPLEVQFTDLSTGIITNWLWDFGDGHTALARNPSHTYQNAGIYTVKLTVVGPHGSDSNAITDYINVEELISNFTADTTYGAAPLFVQFHDQSIGSINGWAWDFGDGETSSFQNPSHTYEEMGVYTVKLKVTNQYGTDSVIVPKFIYVSVVKFGDQNLENAVRKEIQKPTGYISYTDIEKLSSLTAYQSDIKELSGLEYAINLHYLCLDNNLIVALHPLANLMNLHELLIRYNDIIDISPLSNLINLELLCLEGNRVHDLSYLSALSNLASLRLDDNQISSISSFPKLINLQDLSIYNNLISNIDSLPSLPHLLGIDLGLNKIKDFSPLSKQSNLRILHLINSQISDVSSLSNLTSLTYLRLSYNEISDISSLSNLTNLNTLYLSHNKIIDISSLSNLTKLGLLSLKYNNIIDISSLPGSLYWLSISNNNVNDIARLSDLVSLMNLGIKNNQLDDNDLPNLYSLKKLDNSIIAIGEDYASAGDFEEEYYYLDLRGNLGFTEHAIRNLADELPYINYEKIKYNKKDPSFITSISLNEEIKIYPNPVNGIGTISYPKGKEAIIRFFDATGRMIKEIKDNDRNGITDIDLNNWNSSFYICRLVDSDGLIYSGKVMKE